MLSTYHVMSTFQSKKSGFWKGESSALAVQLKAEREPLPRKTPPIFLSQDPNACYLVKSRRGIPSTSIFH